MTQTLNRSLGIVAAAAMMALFWGPTIRPAQAQSAAPAASLAIVTIATGSAQPVVM